ncbi:hypothetical protein [Xanthomonas arboricola]|uniref:hypothetical protein n=1 Tax=Xanthomonas arboricola TaxID=56448 RepID=UPI00187B73C8|nr:hypothetical protein [Xanthomonas arboricola]
MKLHLKLIKDTPTPHCTDCHDALRPDVMQATRDHKGRWLAQHGIGQLAWRNVGMRLTAL